MRVTSRMPLRARDAVLGCMRRGLGVEVHGDAVSVARALIFLAAAGTLLANPLRDALTPMSTASSDAAALAQWQTSHCAGVRQLSSYCLAPPATGRLVHLLLVVVLLVAASGYRPRLLAVPAWWAVWSTYVSFFARDGGDRIQGILALLLVLVSCTDGRRWAWRRHEAPRPLRPAAQIVARYALALAALQISVIYAVAGGAKLVQQQWRDGTSVQHWAHDLTFGLHGPAEALLPLADASAVALAVSWGTITLELCLGAAILLPRRYRRRLLAPGALLHLGILLLMGLTSFALTMWAALLLFTWPLARRGVAPEGLIPAPRDASREPLSASSGSPVRDVQALGT